MLEIILAMTPSYGIGKNGKLPFHCPEELLIFKMKTMGRILVMGRKTIQNLPFLKGRTIIGFTKTPLFAPDSKNSVTWTSRFEDVIGQEDVIIAGGAQIYNFVFKNYMNFISKMHISIMKNDVECDTFVDIDLSKWCIIERTEYEHFNHYVLVPKASQEYLYLNLLREVYENGLSRVGRNGETKSLFGNTMTFDLTDGFPLLTTKKMFFRGVFEELMFFIRGQTDSTILEDKKINIWKGNTNRAFLDSIGKTNRREGIMGPMYGYSWRNFNAPYDEEKAEPRQPGMDQLKEVIKLIRNNPTSRRILLTNYNPLQAHEGVLFCCHSIIIQFYVQDDYLDMFCYNRSSDLFHGLPFNIASSSLFLSLIAKLTQKIPRKFVLSLGDCHIYKQHYDSVETQLKRLVYTQPRLEIRKEINTLSDLEDLHFQDVKIVSYKSYPSIKAAMVE